MGSSNDGFTSAQGAGEAEPDQERSGGIFSRLLRKALISIDPDALNASQDGEGTGRSVLDIDALRRIRVDDVAIPKGEMVTMAIDSTPEELLESFRTHGFSRIPVHGGSMDEPLGVLTLKDFALKGGLGSDPATFDLRALLRPLIYVPPSMPLTVLLRQMQAERRHMALVIDEYGGVDGLVTFEDVIETLVGDVLDEHDIEDGPEWVADGPGRWLVQAGAALDDLEAEIGTRLRLADEDQEVDTLGGLAAMRAGRVPGKGEVIELENGARIEVIDAERHRIRRLCLTLPGPTAEGSAA